MNEVISNRFDGVSGRLGAGAVADSPQDAPGDGSMGRNLGRGIGCQR